MHVYVHVYIHRYSIVHAYVLYMCMRTRCMHIIYEYDHHIYIYIYIYTSNMMQYRWTQVEYVTCKLQNSQKDTDICMSWYRHVDMFQGKRNEQ